MKRIAIVGLVAASIAVREALIDCVGRVHVVDVRSAKQIRRELERVEIEEVTQGTFWASPSPRKSKGEKKRAASSRRKNGWY